MSDPIETALQRLRDQKPPGGFASADAVRRRGIRRTYRQIVAAGVAVLAIVGGVVTWAETHTDRLTQPVTTSPTPSPSGTRSATTSPTPSPSGTPSAAPPVALTPAMFLTAADLGAGDLVIGQAGEVGRDLWMWQDVCQPYRRADYPSLANRAQMDWRDFTRTGGYGAGFQMIERYEPGAGPRNFDDVRARLRDCAGLHSPDPAIGNLPLRWTLVANGFAGDDAVLAKKELLLQGGRVRVSFAVAVRVGDLVSTVWLDDVTSEAIARDIAATTAARLR
jgi:hypothetical protein